MYIPNADSELFKLCEILADAITKHFVKLLFIEAESLLIYNNDLYKSISITESKFNFDYFKAFIIGKVVFIEISTNASVSLSGGWNNSVFKIDSKYAPSREIRFMCGGDRNGTVIVYLRINNTGYCDIYTGSSTTSNGLYINIHYYINI